MTKKKPYYEGSAGARSGDSRPAGDPEGGQAGGDDPADDSSSTRERVFDFLILYKREHDGLSPTAKQIAEALFLSESTVKYHLLRLENEGRVRLLPRRGIEVIGGEWAYPDEEDDG